MEKFKGIIPALLTPFNRKDYTINFDSLKKLVSFNNNFGVNGFYVGGSTAEAMLMSPEERKLVFKCVAESNEGKATLIAHVGAISTDMAIDMAKSAKEMGYDAISAVAPFYYGFSFDDIKNYYYDIINAVDMPMIIYNFPNSGSFTFTPERANEVLKEERIIGIKHTSNDLFTLERFKNLDREIVVYNGFDEMLIGGLSMGADGGIGSTYNFMQKKYIDLFNFFKNGNFSKAQEIQFEVNKIINILIKYGVFNCEKQILTEMGIDMGICRRPFRAISEEGKTACKLIVSQL